MLRFHAPVLDDPSPGRLRPRDGVFVVDAGSEPDDVGVVA